MSEGLGPQRYCRNCGAEIRSGISFCVSCGASLASGQTDSNPTSSESSPSEQTASPTNTNVWGLAGAASLILVLVLALALTLMFGSNSDGVYGSDSRSGEVGESESSYAAPDSQDPEGGDAEYAYSEANDGTVVKDLDIPEMYPGDAPIHYLHSKGSIVVFTSDAGHQLEENCHMVVLPNGNPLFYSQAAPDEYRCVHLVGFPSRVSDSPSAPYLPCATAPDGTWYCTDPSMYVTKDDLKLADDAGYLPE